LRHSAVLSARSTEQAAVCGAAHQHDRLHRERKSADVHLWHVGDDTRAFADRIIVERLSTEQHLASFRLKQPKQSFEQRRLAATVRSEQRQHLAGRECDVETASNRTIRISDGEVAAFYIHDQVLCMLASSQIKKGVPTTAVRIPSGISTSAAVRASVEMTSKSPPQRIAACGNSRAKSGPTSERARGGTTRPTQPMIPAVATLADVTSVAAATIATRNGPVATPNARASSSGSDITFMRHRSATST